MWGCGDVGIWGCMTDVGSGNLEIWGTRETGIEASRHRGMWGSKDEELE